MTSILAEDKLTIPKSIVRVLLNITKYNCYVFVILRSCGYNHFLMFDMIVSQLKYFYYHNKFGRSVILIERRAAVCLRVTV